MFRNITVKINIFIALFCAFFLLSPFSLLLASPGVGLGLQTSVQENEYNRAARQLNQKASDLDQRQQALDELQLQIAQSNQRRDQILVLVGLTLFTLIIVNYYLDLHRRKQGILKT